MAMLVRHGDFNCDFSGFIVCFYVVESLGFGNFARVLLCESFSVKKEFVVTL